MDSPRANRFGGFVLNGARGCLEDVTGAERFLRPKSYRVLEVLSERRGQLVSKDELVQKTWPDVIVSDDSLAHCVSDIRRALGPEGAGLLRTIPRRGYMLVTEGAGPMELSTPGQKPGVARAGWVAAALIVAAIGFWWTLPQDATLGVPDAADPAVMRADALLEARDWRRREDNERARTLLGYAPAVDLANGMRRTTAWLRAEGLVAP